MSQPPLRFAAIRETVAELIPNLAEKPIARHTLPLEGTRP